MISVTYLNEDQGFSTDFHPKKTFLRNPIVLIAVGLLILPKAAYSWGSNEGAGDDTHQRIARQAADLLDENIERYQSLQAANEILQWNMDRLEEGAVAPDFNTDTPYYIGADMLCMRVGRSCRATNLYSDHFYDADSREGLQLSSVLVYNSRLLPGALGDIPPENAESQTRRYIGIALATWQDAVREQQAGNTEKADSLFGEAVFWLGNASHYFSDIFEPHHAANYPWGPVNHSHSEFEELVDQYLDDFLPEGEVRPNGRNYRVTEDYPSITTLVTHYANQYATQAKSYLKDCIHGYFRGFPKAWKNAAAVMTRANRDVLSLLYFRFLSEVTGQSKQLDETNSVGQFNVEIQMGDGFIPKPRERHPSETISLRIDFIDGDSKTYVLDTNNFFRWYSFNTDATSSYFLEWDDEMPSPAEVERVTLLRDFDRSTTPWQLESLSIYIHGKRVLNAVGTMPLESGGEIVLPVDEGF